jgi:hypothetical protein
MSYPAHLFSTVKKQPNLFLCEKDGKKLFLFGTYHVLPFSVIPEAYVEIMKTAKTLLLETCELPPTEADLISGGFFSSEPQSKGFDEKLTVEARHILEIAIKKYCESIKLPSMALNRIKLDRALWLCRFATNVDGMDDTLRSLFPNNAFSLEKRGHTKLLPPNSIAELNEDLPAGFGCLKAQPEYPTEILEPMVEYLVGGSMLNPHYCYYQEIEPELVIERNNNWMPIIFSHLQKNNPILVAVGHTHLVGRYGLLCLLQQAGFKIFQYAAHEDSFGRFMPDILFNSLATNRAIAGQVFETLGEIIQDRTSLVLEYWAPPIIFSDIYPNPALEDAKLEAETTAVNTQKVEIAKVPTTKPDPVPAVAGAKKYGL